MNHYEAFYKLHHQAKPFIIANAWNVKSAQLIENNGYAAVATSNAGLDQFEVSIRERRVGSSAGD